MPRDEWTDAHLWDDVASAMLEELEEQMRHDEALMEWLESEESLRIDQMGE